MPPTYKRNGKETESWSRQNTELFHALTTTSLDVKASNDIKVLFEKIAEHATRLLDASGAGLYLSLPERREVLLIACYAIERDFSGTVLRFGEGVAGKVAQSGKPLIVKDYHSWEERSLAFETEKDFRALLGVPMLWQGEVIGVLSIVHTEENRSFSEEDIQKLRPFADYAATRLEYARLLQIENKRRQEAEILHNASTVLNSSLDLHEIFEAFLTHLNLLVPFDSSSLFLTEDEGRILRVAACRGFSDPSEILNAAFPAGDILSSTILRERRAIILDDVQTEPAFSSWGDIENIHSWMGIPLFGRGQIIGYVTCDHHRVGYYTEADAALAEALANQAALVIDNARLFEAERKQLLLAQTLHKVGALLTTEMGLQEVLDQILELLQRVVEFDCAAIHLIDENNKIQLAAGKGFPDYEQAQRVVHQLSSFILDTKWQAGVVGADYSAMVIPDTATSHIWKQAPGFPPIRSWVGAPLLVKGRFIGSLNLDSLSANAYTPAIADTVMAFANQAAAAIENARLFETARKHIAELEALHQASLSLTASLDVSQVFNTILKATLDLLPECDNAHIFIYQEDDDSMSFGAAMDRNGPLDKPISVPRPNGLTYSVAHSGETIVVSEMQSHSLFSGNTQGWVGGIIGLPLKIGDHVVGVMNIKYTQSHGFSVAETHILKLLADQAAIAIEKARLFEQAATEHRHLSLLYDIGRGLTSSLDTHEILQRAITLTCKALNGTMGQGFLYLPDEDRLLLQAYYGKETSSLQAVSDQMILKPGVGLVGWVIEHRQAALVTDVTQDPHWLRVPGLDDDVRSVLCAPILQGDETNPEGQRLFGALSVFHTQARMFTQGQLHLLQAICREVSMALSNANRYQQVQRRLTESTLIQKLAQVFNQRLEFSVLLKELVSQIAHLLGYYQASIFVKESDALVLKAFAGEEPRSNSDIDSPGLSNAQEIVNRVGLSGQVAFLVGASADVLAVPILRGDEVIGVIHIQTNKPNQLTGQDRELIQVLAGQVSVALENAALYEQLRLYAEDLEIVVNHMPVGTVLLDAGLHTVVANPTAREILAVLAPDLHDSPLQRLGTLTLDELIARQDDPLPLEIVMEGSSRRYFAVQIRAAAGKPGSQAIRSPESHRWALILRETTGERERQDRIQSQERLATVGQLAAGIAHDFNNILAAIQVYTDLLLCDSYISAAGLEKVKTIQKQVQRATSLIRQILDFSRQSIMDRHALDLLSFMKELDKMLARVLPETIRLELVHHPGSYWVNADPSRLQQALMNLALNGRDAMPGGGSLRFELRNLNYGADDLLPFQGMQTGNWVTISVSDSGSGIPMDVRPHIFEPFFSTKPIGQGTGLGLAQVYGIIKQHDGFIECKSEIGKGTSFVIYLPPLSILNSQDAEDDSAFLLEDASRQNYPEEQRSILLVEDDTAAREAIKALLDSMHFHVITASDGTEALRQFRQKPNAIDLVVSDIVMPKMGGLELFSALKETFPDVKVLFISGHPLEDQNQMLLEEKLKGNDIHWLQKPFLARDFFRAIQSLIDGG